METVCLPKGRLQRMELLRIVGKTLHRRDLATVHLHRKEDAGTHGNAVEQDSAGAARTVLAADMRAGQVQLMAQKVR